MAQEARIVKFFTDNERSEIEGKKLDAKHYLYYIVDEETDFMTDYVIVNSAEMLSAMKVLADSIELNE